MIKLVRGLGMRCLKVTQARGLCMNVNYTLEIIIFVFIHVDRHIYCILKMSQNGYRVDAIRSRRRNLSVLSQDLYEILVLGFCGFPEHRINYKKC